MLKRFFSNSMFMRRSSVAICAMLGLGLFGVGVFGKGAAKETKADAASAVVWREALEVEAGSQAPMTAQTASALIKATEASDELLPVDASKPKQQVVRVIRMEVTAYCPCTLCCGPGAHGVTASGKRVTFNQGHFVAADTRLLPFGTKLVIPGYNGGKPVQVIDRGGAIKGNRLDVFFPSHQQALEWGRRTIEVTVVQ